MENVLFNFYSILRECKGKVIMRMEKMFLHNQQDLTCFKENVYLSFSKIGLIKSWQKY